MFIVGSVERNRKVKRGWGGGLPLWNEHDV